MDTIRADANLTSFEEAFIDAMGKENMTVDEYIKLTHTPLSQLSEKDIKRIYNVNSAVANPTNDVLMSKVIPEGTYINCIENGNFSDKWEIVLLEHRICKIVVHLMIIIIN